MSENSKKLNFGLTFLVGALVFGGLLSLLNVFLSPTAFFEEGLVIQWFVYLIETLLLVITLSIIPAWKIHKRDINAIKYLQYVCVIAIIIHLLSFDILSIIPYVLILIYISFSKQVKGFFPETKPFTMKEKAYLIFSVIALILSTSIFYLLSV